MKHEEEKEPFKISDVFKYMGAITFLILILTFMYLITNRTNSISHDNVCKMSEVIIHMDDREFTYKHIGSFDINRLPFVVSTIDADYLFVSGITYIKSTCIE